MVVQFHIQCSPEGHITQRIETEEFVRPRCSKKKIAGVQLKMGDSKELHCQLAKKCVDIG